MENYLQLLERTVKEGTVQRNRTGINTLRIEGAHLQFDLRKGFPAVTTKKLAFNQVKGELIGFLNGASNAAEFRSLGCTIWDQNANENEQWLANPNRLGTDDLGRIYGVQWRDWTDHNGNSIDQIEQAVNKIMYQPTDRRIIVTAWNPDELGVMALPPCHVMHQYIVDLETRELSLCMYQRSCDMFLGVPFNIASYALLLEMMAASTGYKAKMLNIFMADVHVYENHVPQVLEQLTRQPYELPKLKLDVNPFAKEGMETLMSFQPRDISLEHYQYHPAIKGAMAV